MTKGKPSTLIIESAMLSVSVVGIMGNFCFKRLIKHYKQGAISLGHFVCAVPKQHPRPLKDGGAGILSDAPCSHLGHTNVMIAPSLNF